MNPSFGDLIRNTRRDRGLDLKELEVASGVVSSLTSRLENNLSQPTVTTAVNLAYALHIPLNELASALGIKGYLTRLDDGRPQFKNDTFHIRDIEAFLESYRASSTDAKELLCQLYSRVLRALDPELTGLAAYQKAADKIFEATRGVGGHFVPLSYPPDLNPSHLEELLISGGVLIYPDVGFYIRRERMKLGLTMMRVAEQAGVSHSAISRLERGALERINLNEIIALDRILGVEGEILAMSWKAGQLYSGVIRNIADDLEFEPPLAWYEGAIPIIETLVKIERWYTSLDIDFLEDYRKGVP